MNNTEINTRLGWYSKTVQVATNDQHSTTTTTSNDNTNKDASAAVAQDDGGWNGATPFPLIQGTDCCGRVVQVASSDYKHLLGQRVIIQPCMRLHQNYDNIAVSASSEPQEQSSPTVSAGQLYDNVWMASDFPGAFAQYVKVPATHVHMIQSNSSSLSHWTDAALASLPCAYGTAENMIHRCQVSADDHVLIPGASGGVGSAIVQLVQRRGARITAIVGNEHKAHKMRQLLNISQPNDKDNNTNSNNSNPRGHSVIVGRPGSVEWTTAIEQLGKDQITVLIDNVAGPGFPKLFDTLARGGRMATSGAIAGPMVDLDFRTLYLKDITLHGCTSWDPPVMKNLVQYVQNNEIQPLVEHTRPLQEIGRAQTEFLEKQHVGKIVLIPPP